MSRILPSVSPKAFRSPAPKARLCLLWCVSNILSHFLLMTLGLLQASISLQRDRNSIPPFHCLARFPFSTPTFRVCLLLLTLYMVSSRFLCGSFQNTIITLTLSVTLSSEWIFPVPQRVNLFLPLNPTILPQPGNSRMCFPLLPLQTLKLSSSLLIRTMSIAYTRRLLLCPSLGCCDQLPKITNCKGRKVHFKGFLPCFQDLVLSFCLHSTVGNVQALQETRKHRARVLVSPSMGNAATLLPSPVTPYWEFSHLGCTADVANPEWHIICPCSSSIL